MTARSFGVGSPQLAEPMMWMFPSACSSVFESRPVSDGAKDMSAVRSTNRWGSSHPGQTRCPSVPINRDITITSASASAPEHTNRTSPTPSFLPAQLAPLKHTIAPPPPPLIPYQSSIVHFITRSHVKHSTSQPSILYSFSTTILSPTSSLDTHSLTHDHHRDHQPLTINFNFNFNFNFK